MIADCAAVGFGFSTGSSPILLGFPEDDEGEVDELLLPLSLLLKLHAITASTNTSIHGRCFIGVPDLSVRESKMVVAFYLNASPLSTEMPLLNNSSETAKSHAILSIVPL
jgi:hypothetical protein